MSLEFLSQVVLDPTASLRKQAEKGGPRKQWCPTKASLRLWKSGAIYPSAALVAKYNLEYKPKKKDEEGKWQEAENPGNGFDICATADFPAFKAPQPLVVISPVSRIHPKVDIFGTVTYFDEADEAGKLGTAGEPKVTVLEQGSKTFGKDVLLPMLEEVYGVVPNEEGWIDLEILVNPATQEGWKFEGPVFIPKLVSRGEDKGKKTVTRRENSVFYVLYPDMETCGKASAEKVSNEPEVTVESNTVPTEEETEALNEAFTNPSSDEDGAGFVFPEE